MLGWVSNHPRAHVKFAECGSPLQYRRKHTLEYLELGSPFDLSGAIAVITGASAGGLGHQIAMSLARAGATIHICDLPAQAAGVEKVAQEVVSGGGVARTHTFDVANEGQVAHAVAAIASEAGSIDILVNCAGVVLRKSALEVTEMEWRRILDVNLTGTWFACQAVGRQMVERRRGKIINVASQLALIAGPIPESAYYASKAGVVNLTRGLAAEWGPFGVNVNCLAPGFFYPTKMTSELQGQPARLQAATDRTMLKRLGNPGRDIGPAAVFLASSAADYITGATLVVDGGWTAW